jgi:hypothetical protein
LMDEQIWEKNFWNFSHNFVNSFLLLNNNLLNLHLSFLFLFLPPGKWMEKNFLA